MEKKSRDLKEGNRRKCLCTKKSLERGEGGTLYLSYGQKKRVRSRHARKAKKRKNLLWEERRKTNGKVTSSKYVERGRRGGKD